MKGEGTGKVTLRVILTPRSRRSLPLLRDRHEDDHYEDEQSGTSSAETWSTDEPPRLLKSKEKSRPEESNSQTPSDMPVGEESRSPILYLEERNDSNPRRAADHVFSHNTCASPPPYESTYSRTSETKKVEP